MILMVSSLVLYQLGPLRWWMGASDQSLEGRWMWSKSQDYVGEYIWGGSHPEDDLARNYLYLSPQSYYADDGPVNEQYNFICQYKQF